jgi:branched-chain amino acid transport system permease protein
LSTILQLGLSGVMIGGIYALMSVGLTLIFGVLRIVNFAHGEFLMMAMYAAWAANAYLGLNPYVSAIAIVPGLFLFGAIIYRFVVDRSLDKPHLVVVFATMALSIFMQNVALMLFSADLHDVPALGSGRSVQIAGVYARPELLIGFAVSLAVTGVLVWALRATYPGKAVRATVQDREAAELMGIKVPTVFLVTFAIGSALVGLAGCIMLPLFSVFPSVGLNFVLIAFVVVVLGGMGSVEGALLGGILIGVIQSLSSYYVAPAYGQMFYFLLFLLVMIVRPSGLLGQKGAATVGMND